MPVIVIALVLALAGAGGTVYAAQDARPGEALFGVKSVAQEVTASLTAGATRNTGKNSTFEARGAPEGRGKNGKQGAETSQVVTGTLSAEVTQAITSTLASVSTLENDDLVPGKSENGLEAKLRAASASLARGNTAAAINQLDAFVHQLNAMRRSGHISEANYTALYNQYSSLVSALGAQAEPTVSPNAKGVGAAGGDDDEGGAQGTGDNDDGPGQGKGKSNGPRGRVPR